MSFRSTSFASYGPILAAALIAGAVYLLVAVRFGQPLRDANAAIDKVNDVHERLPSYVERAVKQQVGAGINSQEIAELRGALADLTTELEKLRSSAERADSTAAAARREAEDAKRAMVALQTQVANASFSTVMASPAPEHRPSPSDASGVSSTAEPTTSVPPRPTTVVRDGPIQMELLGHSVTSRGIVLEMSLTRLSDGDAAVRVYMPGTYPLVRIITGDGFESMRGQLTGSNGRTGELAIAMVEGIPVRMKYLFEGKFNGPVRCSAIDLKVRETQSREWRSFRFSDILVSPE